MSLSGADQSPDMASPDKRVGSFLDKSAVLRLGITMVLALCLIVPESEVRAKLFKANLILNNVLKAHH